MLAQQQHWSRTLCQQDAGNVGESAVWSRFSTISFLGHFLILYQLMWPSQSIRSGFMLLLRRWNAVWWTSTKAIVTSWVSPQTRTETKLLSLTSRVLYIWWWISSECFPSPQDEIPLLDLILLRINLGLTQSQFIAPLPCWMPNE